MLFFAAPLQGYTEAAFRHFHAEVYGGCNGAADAYFTPFVRVEHGEARGRDMRDARSVLNANHVVIPQIIARDAEEFAMLADILITDGRKVIDLNMGCPFPPQMKKGRGAALVQRRDVLARIADFMRAKAAEGVRFTAKMRLGADRADEWWESIEVINAMPFEHVTVHARVGRQQYGGELHLEEFRKLADSLVHQVVWNGDLRTPADIDAIVGLYSSLAGVMAGRGLLARPSLIAEWHDGCEWDRPQRIGHLLALHDGVRRHYEATLCGESQILSKLKPFWDYLEPEIGHKTAKAIGKATSVARYEEAIASIM